MIWPLIVRWSCLVTTLVGMAYLVGVVEQEPNWVVSLLGLVAGASLIVFVVSALVLSKRALEL